MAYDILDIMWQGYQVGMKEDMIEYASKHTTVWKVINEFNWCLLT